MLGGGACGIREAARDVSAERVEGNCRGTFLFDARVDRRSGQRFAELSRQRDLEISWRRSSNVSIFISIDAKPPSRGMTGVHAGRSGSETEVAPEVSKTEESTQRESGLPNQRSAEPFEKSGSPEILNLPSLSVR